MAASYHLNVSSTKNQRFPFFVVRVMEFSIISSCLGKVKNFPISLPSNLSRRSTFARKG